MNLESSRGRSIPPKDPGIGRPFAMRKVSSLFSQPARQSSPYAQGNLDLSSILRNRRKSLEIAKDFVVSPSKEDSDVGSCRKLKSDRSLEMIESVNNSRPKIYRASLDALNLSLIHI